MLDFEPAASEVIRLLDGVPDDALAGPTPCPGYPVAALLDHLARATGQSFHCDPASVAVVMQFAGKTVKPENAGMRDGLFGPVVQVPVDGSELDRALGLAGRQPDWTP